MRKFTSFFMLLVGGGLALSQAAQAEVGPIQPSPTPSHASRVDASRRPMQRAMTPSVRSSYAVPSGISSAGVTTGSDAGVAGISSGGVTMGSNAGLGISSGGATGTGNKQVTYQAASQSGAADGFTHVSGTIASYNGSSIVILTPTNQLFRVWVSPSAYTALTYAPGTRISTTLRPDPANPGLYSFSL